MTAKMQVRFLLVVLFIVAVVLSSSFTAVKYRALGFHTRDYDFYAQFITKLFDQSTVGKTYTMNPDGYNIFFFNGTEGTKSLHQSLHFEPVKYLYALIYYLTNDLRAVFISISILFFLPILYLAGVHPLDSAGNRAFILLLALLYVVYPSSLKVPSYDLRPYIILAPLFAMAMIAVILSRSIGEVMLLFNGMFLAREEALVFGAIIIGYAFIKLDGSPSRKRIVKSLLLAWSAWFLAVLVFFLWAGYPNKRLAQAMEYFFRHPLLSSLLGLLGCAAALLAVTVGARLYRKKVITSGVMQVAVYSMVFPPLLFQFVRDERTQAVLDLDVPELARTLFSLRYSLHFITMAVLFIILWHHTKSSASRRVILFCLALGISVSVVLAFGPSYAITRQRSSYTREADDASAVFALRRSTDKAKTRILADLATHQAFYDFHHAYVYDRLPWQRVPGQGRFFPANSQVLQALVNEEMEYIMISKASMGNVRQLLKNGGLSAGTVFENAKFIALRIVR